MRHVKTTKDELIGLVILSVLVFTSCIIFIK